MAAGLRSVPRALAVLPIRLYQLTLGLLLPPACPFHPSCSEYAVQAIRMNGAVRGGAQAVWRLLRCGPWSVAGIDEPQPLQPLLPRLMRPVRARARRLAGVPRGPGSRPRTRPGGASQPAPVTRPGPRGAARILRREEARAHG